MPGSYPAMYRDKYGEETTTLINDRSHFSLTVRGVEFAGPLEFLQAQTDIENPLLASFTCVRITGADMNQHHQIIGHSIRLRLVGYELEFEMPVSVVENELVTEGRLRVEFKEPEVEERRELWRGRDPSLLGVTLHYGGHREEYQGNGSAFGHALWKIRQQLPATTYVKSCATCRVSQYSIFGNWVFGSLECYRDNKEAFLAANTKADFAAIAGSVTEMVAETYLCSEYDRATP